MGILNMKESSLLTNIGQSKFDVNLKKLKDINRTSNKSPHQATTLTNHFRQISQAIVNKEWNDISSQVDTFTLPLEKYVLAKGGQPIRTMVRHISIINNNRL